MKSQNWDNENGKAGDLWKVWSNENGGYPMSYMIAKSPNVAIIRYLKIFGQSPNGTKFQVRNVDNKHLHTVVFAYRVISRIGA